MQLNESISLKLVQLFSSAISAKMSAVTQPFRPCHAKQATVQLSMAKHDNKNISLLLWYIVSRTLNSTFEMTNQKNK